MNESIGFSAKMSQFRVLSTNERVPFDDVITNFGGHYNADTYLFTCPVHGVYTFTMATNQYDHDNIQTGLLRNEEIIIRVAAEREAYRDSSSATIITECNAGDSVYVRVLLGGRFEGEGGVYNPCHFSGYLLHKFYK